MSPGYNTGVSTHAKGYPRCRSGPMRDVLIHRAVAAALIGRDLDKSEEVHHFDGDRRNFHWANLLVLGHIDHGWVSSRQAWYMREQDRKEKLAWDEFMGDKAGEFSAEIAEAKANGMPWRGNRVDGGMAAEWTERVAREAQEQQEHRDSQC